MVFQIKQTDEFRDWLARLRDIKARARIEARIDLLGKGNAGDSAPVGAGVSEMRIDFGPGYRVYYKRMGKVLIVLFCGGTKGTQTADIKRAVQLSKLEWE